jgi:hypothetical protein
MHFVSEKRDKPRAGIRSAVLVFARTAPYVVFYTWKLRVRRDWYFWVPDCRRSQARLTHKFQQLQQKRIDLGQKRAARGFAVGTTIRKGLQFAAGDPWDEQAWR